MANPFDQFDEPAAAAGPVSAANPAIGGSTADPALEVDRGTIPKSVPTSNPFDQFDAPADAGAHSLTIHADAPAWITPRTWSGTALDLLQSGATGIEKGAIGAVGAPSDIAHLAGQGYAKVLAYGRSKLGLDPVPVDLDNPYDFTKLAQSSALTKGFEAAAGPMYEPQTTAGQYAQTIGEFVPTLATGGAGAAGEAASAAPAVGRTIAAKVADLVATTATGTGSAVAKAVLPGAGSELAGQYTQGTAAEPYARAIGALAGGGLNSAVSRAVTPMSIDPARLAAVQALKDEGVTSLTAGQVTGSKTLRNLESQTAEIPFGGGRAAEMDATSKAQFNKAVMGRMGSTADNALPENFAPAKAAIGNSFDDLSSRNTLQVDPQFHADLKSTLDQYGDVLPSERKPQVYNILSDILDQTQRNGGAMSGDMYQATRSRLGQYAQMAKTSDPEFAGTMKGFQSALDDAMTRSISPEDAAAWHQARGQYSASKVIEKAATGAGENAALGNISPAQLRSAAVVGRRAGYATGSGPFDDLARAGSAVMSPLPNSGTAGRITALSLLGGGSGSGAAIGGFTGGPIGAVVGTAAGLATPAIASRVLMSRPMQAYLKNQVLPRAAPMTRADFLQAMASRGNAIAAARLNNR